MDRAEAIKVLEATETEMLGCFTGATSDNFAKFMQRRIDAIDMAIAALREQEQSKWISVKERLPEKSGEYLVVSEKGQYIGVLDYSAVHKAFNADDDLDDAQYAVSCTHWRPLPEPPAVQPSDVSPSGDVNRKEGAEG